MLQIFGKPSNEMVDSYSKCDIEYPKSESVMGGDRLYTDIALGK